MLQVNTKLSQLRRELIEPKISQGQLAQQAGISRQWYHRLETGKQEQIGYTTAQALLKAINTEREKRELPALVLEQLELRIV